MRLREEGVARLFALGYDTLRPIIIRRIAMDAVTPKSKHDTLDTHSHVVRPAAMEWKKTRFSGCEVKGLLLDKETGVVTALMKFAPGAVLPDHEHVKIEQTYVLEGRLVDKEGPAEGLIVGPGEFVWREAGSRHVAWTPEGGLMLAMFQVPNKFFESDGRVTDLSGTDWDALWGHVFKD
jgi:anti-sigma factor ChrR (cupin superfamily)